MGFNQSVEGVDRKTLTSLEKEGVLPSHWLPLELNYNSSSPAYWSNKFWACQASTIAEADFLK